MLADLARHTDSGVHSGLDVAVPKGKLSTRNLGAGVVSAAAAATGILLAAPPAQAFLSHRNEYYNNCAVPGDAHNGPTRTVDSVSNYGFASKRCNSHSGPQNGDVRIITWDSHNSAWHNWHSNVGSSVVRSGPWKDCNSDGLCYAVKIHEEVKVRSSDNYDHSLSGVSHWGF